MNEISQSIQFGEEFEQAWLIEKPSKNNIIVDNQTFNYFFGKRLMDLCLALSSLLFLLPLTGIVALLVKLTSPGPVIFKQKRIGLGGREFMCYKFRTMNVDAEKQLQELLTSNTDAAKEWADNHKLKVDPRLTPIGKFLRMTSLDELPQLWNILKGEMSLVGPRPIVRDEIAKYGKKFFVYTSVPPGITGIWQINGRSNTTYEERIAMDADYVDQKTIWLDLMILLKTLPAVLTSKGAY